MLDIINTSLQTKLQSLISFLRQITRGFDTIAEEIDCINLKTALMALSVESKQYAKEISDQLEHFDIPVSPDATEQVWDGIEMNVHEQAGFAKGGEIAALCNNCEAYYRNLYEDVLREYLPYKSLKNIIMYQLAATQFAFMKIRLLNTLRFSQQ